MKKISILCLLCAMSIMSLAQKTENIILVSLDGLRWQELFGGADSLLVDDSKYVENPEELTEEFWVNDPLQRREMLMPFFWNTIAVEGQLYGNRKYGNKVDCSNQMWFSYPGYNEILTGFADDENISSNDKINNPNVTILEHLNNTKKYKGQVAAFGSWDVFPYIINRERSGLPINAGFEKATDSPSETESFLNKIQDEIRGPWGGVRLDVFTHHYAMEYMKKNKPKVLYVAYGETDDFAHDGEYDQYLKSAKQTDAYIKELWDYAQSQDQYKGKTTLIITTDHGRGTHPKKTWQHHGNRIKDAGEIWIAVMGPDSPAKGEIKEEGQFYQNQVARTVMEALGEKYKQPKAGEAVQGAIQ
ncbi:sulfatase-like hydrolase/transferase [Reichenbachiella sp. MSK19-1]|uniref:sulfatase-like hydrolase/transferase n=1 Tax=Reichenbachiella sp. MSK19-1 TaxID=1897631 RepID=UPI000E6C0F4A|nr:sulfatase-like hydrolase/transferase [Reichenbachiella sp. MSK19-1]RJE72771.1 phosphoglyceromutase [Reichenbachiella sp. MSK19-1]